MKTAADLFAGEKREWVNQCRVTARILLTQKPYITINDVLAEVPRPKYIKANNTGLVFKHPDFKKVGVTQATHQAAHRRLVYRWALSDELQHVQRMIAREYDEVV